MKSLRVLWFFLSRKNVCVASSLALGGCLSGATLTTQDTGDVARVSAYLNGLPRFEAKFVQSGDFGPGAGLVWLDRPGHLRLDYEGAGARVMVISGGRVRVLDRATGALTTQPLSRTPLGLLLGPNINLAAGHLDSVTRGGGNLRVVVSKPGAAAQGTLTIDFADQPLLLRAVTVTDPYHRNLTLTLSDLNTAPVLTENLFQPPVPPPPS